MTVKVQDHPTTATLYVSSDKVRVLLDCPDPHRDLPGTVAQIAAACEELKLPQYPDAEFLTQALKNICQPGDDITGAVLVMGTPPVPCRDARLDWSRDYFIEGWATDPKGERVDFWAKLDNRSVTAGEELLTVHPPVAGEPGFDVYGNTVAVGKPVHVKVRCGKGVTETAKENGVRVFSADIAGRLRFNDNTVTVEEVYLIKGDVCLETGNISHTGTVQIEGDVKTGATITAGGDVVVKGLLEPADLQVGGSLTVHGGIIGSPETALVVDGEVIARYAREASITATGDVIVTGEINYCDIICRGKVDASRGRIVGGSTYARQGIVTGEAGASGASQTLLAAGADPASTGVVAAGRKKIRQMEKARGEIRRAIETARQKADPLNGSEVDFLAGLEAKVYALGQSIAKVENEIRKTLDAAQGGAREEVFMLRECWSGTIIQFGEDKFLVRSSILKPRVAKRINGAIRVVPLGEENGPSQF